MADISRLPGPIADIWDWQFDGACRGADPDLFYDSVHMRRENSERLVSSLLARPRNYDLSEDVPRQVFR